MEPLILRPLVAFVVVFILTTHAFAQLPMLPGGSNSGFANQGVKVKSYREWKNEVIAEAQIKISNYKAQMENSKPRMTASGGDPKLKNNRETEAVVSKNISLEKLERELRHEQYGLEMARDLTVTDYFAGYLTKVQNKKAAFQEVAGKLSPEEVAELMSAYANSVFGVQTADFPPSATNLPKDTIK